MKPERALVTLPLYLSCSKSLGRSVVFSSNLFLKLIRNNEAIIVVVGSNIQDPKKNRKKARLLFFTFFVPGAFPRDFHNP